MQYVFSPTQRWLRPSQYLQTSLQDVSCCILITVRHVATERADMRPDTEGLVHILTTLRALLRCVVRSHSNHLATSTFSLVLQELSEHSPGCISDRECQRMVPHHVGGFQIFNDNGLVLLDVLMGSFMQGIFALVCNMLMNTSDLLLRFLQALDYRACEKQGVQS